MVCVPGVSPRTTRDTCPALLPCGNRVPPPGHSLEKLPARRPGKSLLFYQNENQA